MVFENPDDFIRGMHDLGFIDYHHLSWNNFDHVDPRGFVPLEKFKKRLDVINDALFYVPPSLHDPVPLTEVILYLSIDGARTPISFVGTVRPLSDKEILLKPEEFTATKSRVELLAKAAIKMPDSDVFSPHLLGVADRLDRSTVYFYPFREGADFDTLIELLEKQDHSEFFPRDSSLSLRNRMKYALDLFALAGYVHPSAKAPAVNTSKFAYEIRKNTFNLLLRDQLVGGWEHLPYREFSEDLRDGVLEDKVSTKYLLTIKDFGKGVLGKTVPAQTVPLLLTSNNPSSGVAGVFNCGMYMKHSHAADRTYDVLFSPWADRDFACQTSNLLKDYYGIKSVPLFKPDAKGPFVSAH